MRRLCDCEQCAAIHHFRDSMHWCYSDSFLLSRLVEYYVLQYISSLFQRVALIRLPYELTETKRNIIFLLFSLAFVRSRVITRLISTDTGIRKLAWHWAWRACWSAWWAWLYPTAQDFERGERGCEWDRSGIWAWSWTNCSGLSVVSAGVSTWAKGVCVTTSITLYTGVTCWSTIHHWKMIATRLL